MTPTATIDFTLATNALGTAATDTATFLTVQSVTVIGALMLVGAVVALLVALARGAGIRKKVGAIGGSGRGRR